MQPACSIGAARDYIGPYIERICSVGLLNLVLRLLLLLLADREQFHFEDQGFAGADISACSAVAVG